MSRGAKGSAGFSLLEMLVGLTLLALISVAVTQSVRTGLRLWQAAEANDSESEWQQTGWLIERWLSRALSPKSFDLDSRVIFEANPDGVRFLVDGQVGRKPSGYSRIGLIAKENPVCPARSDFVLTWEDVTFAGNFAPGASDERVLFECVDGLAFEYVSATQTERAFSAGEVFEASDELPRVVRIRFTKGGKARTLSARLQYAR